MSSDLIDYLHTACTPERAVSILDASDTLSKLGMSTHEDSISQILTLAEEGHTDETLGAILSALHAIYADVINNYGVRYHPDMTLREQTELVSGLEQLADFLDMEIIVDTLSQGTSPEDTLADLLELVTSTDAEHWFSLLVQVNESLIDRLRVIANDRMKLLNDSFDIDHTTVTALKARLRKQLDEYLPPLVLTTIDQRLWRVGYDYRQIPSTVLHEISNLPEAEIAKVVIAFVCLSNIDDANVRDGIRAMLDIVFEDINRITKVNGAVNQLWRS